MKDFLSLQLFGNDYISLSIKGLIGIIAILLVSSALIYVGKTIKVRIENKTEKWKSFTQIIAKIYIILIIITSLIGIFEILGIELANYMAMPLIKTEKILITPSRLLFIIILLFITWAINSSLKSVFSNYVKTQEIMNFASMNLFKLVKYTLWIVAIAISMQSIGLNLTFVLAGSAALLVGVGIGMQKIFNDMISGFFLLFEQNLKINDVVEVDGIVGKVKDIGIRTSRILTRDNIEMVVPNSKFINDSVINWSYNDRKTRFFVKIGVSYGSNVILVKKILTEITNNHKQILKKPAPYIFFRDFGDSSLNFEIAFWTIYSLDNEFIKSDLRFEIVQKFRENDITIPFPQRDVHIISEDDKM